MDANRLHTTPKLEEHAARFLAAVYGPLGPVEGITAWKAGIVEAERLTAGRTRGTYSLGAALETYAMREDVPAYLAGRSRSEIWSDTASYVIEHTHCAPWPGEPARDLAEVTA